MEDNMGQVNTMIGNLRNMALDMGSELENQNRMIERINAKVQPFFQFIFYYFEKPLFFTKSLKSLQYTGRVQRNEDSSGQRTGTSTAQISCTYVAAFCRQIFNGLLFLHFHHRVAHILFWANQSKLNAVSVFEYLSQKNINTMYKNQYVKIYQNH